MFLALLVVFFPSSFWCKEKNAYFVKIQNFWRKLKASIESLGEKIRLGSFCGKVWIWISLQSITKNTFRKKRRSRFRCEDNTIWLLNWTPLYKRGVCDVNFDRRSQTGSNGKFILCLSYRIIISSTLMEYLHYR